MTMSQYWADLEQQEYDPDEFVERLAFRCVQLGESSRSKKLSRLFLGHFWTKI